MVALVWNYLETVEYSISRVEKPGDLTMIFHGLQNNNGLSNALSNLKIVNEKLVQYSGEILNYCKQSEVEVND